MIIFKLPSLKQLCILRIVTSVWNSTNLKKVESIVTALLQEHEKTSRYNSNPPNKNYKLETEIQKKIFQLPLPEKLIKEMSDYVAPTGQELLAWLYQNFFLFQCKKLLPEKIFWTSRGTVDKKRTASAMMFDKSLSVLERYKLACIYCLDEYIYLLWRRLRRYQKNDLIEDQTNYLTSFWSLKMKNRKIQCTNPYCLEMVFKNSALYGHETACKYFIERLYPEERNRLLSETAPTILRVSSRKHNKLIKKTYHDVILIFLTHMNNKQRIYFARNPLRETELWDCFLSRQWQGSYMDAFDLLTSYTPDYVLKKCLIDCMSRMKDGYTDYSYSQLCRKLWDRTPVVYRRSMIGEFKTRLDGSYLHCLLEIEDEITIEHLLRSLSPQDKIDIFLNNREWFESWIVKGCRWDILIYFLRALSLPIEILAGWRNSYAESFKNMDCRNDAFVGIIDEIITAVI